MPMWMSSSLTLKTISPEAIFSRIRSSPAMIWSFSSMDTMPCSPSMVTWAMLPSMSSLYILWSNPMEALNCFTSSSISFSNRPPHKLAIPLFLPVC